MKVHLLETELAFLSDGETGDSVAGHLRWCARCRNTAADYRWLQGEIEGALAAAADAVPVPRSKWGAVQAGVQADRRRQAVGVHTSSFASVVMAICLMLFAPAFLSQSAATEVEQPQLMVIPAPVTVSVADERAITVNTPTPAICSQEATPLPTPVFVLPPTPPKVEI